MPGTEAKRADFSTKTGAMLSHDAKLRQGALLLVVIWLVLAAAPSIPAPILPGLDPGWVLGLNIAHAQGLAHGKDIVWTYGPLSYLALPDAGIGDMYPALIYRWGIYFLWCVALLRMAWAAATPWKFGVVPLVAFCALLDPLTDHLALAVFAWSLLVIVDRSRWRGAGLAVVTFLTALECMIKVNAGVEAICLFASILLAVFLQEAPLSRVRKWQISGAALLLPVAAVLLYAAGTGTVASLPAYIRNSLEMASGYSEAMSKNGPFSQVLLAVISVVVLFLGLPLLEGSMRALAAGFLPAFIYAFFSFKAGMVRQDAHASNVELNLALAALFLLVFAQRKRSFYFVLFFQAACLLFSYHFISEAWPTTDRTLSARLALKGNLPALKAFLHWPKTWEDLERQGHQNLLPLRVSPELQAMIGRKPVETLPWDVARVRANQWTWRPRPVFQSYAAYTPRLDRLNAEYLQTGRAAEFTLVTWDELDGRYPFLDTPFSWREQLDLYQTVSTESDTLVLARRPTRRFQAIERIGGETTTWGRENRVPQSADPVMVSAQISRSLSGRLRTLLFRLNPLFIEVKRQSGKVERYRALRANFADGVIINELPESLGDIALLASSGCALSDPVVSFHFQTESPGEFQSAISLAWTRLVRRPEAAGNCVAITQTAAKTPIWGGVGTVAVSAGAATSWSATADEPWVTVRPEGPRAGNAAVEYSVLRNAGSEPRQGTIAISGRVFKISQPGPGSTLANRASVQLGFYGAAPSAIEVPPELAGNLDLIMERFDVFPAAEGQPVVGDWTGSGMMRIGMFRDGVWYLDLNGNRRWDGKEGGDGVFSFGLAGDIAVPGDWAGDGKTRLAVFRHGEWAFDMNGNMSFDRSDQFAQFGLAGDIPVVAKWSHDRMDRVGVYRGGTWMVDSNGDGVFERSDERFAFGLAGDIPLVSFGNGKVGVYRHGTCILAPKADRSFDSTALMTIPCGASRPLVAAW
jgi:hypothetical protein